MKHAWLIDDCVKYTIQILIRVINQINTATDQDQYSVFTPKQAQIIETWRHA